MRWLIDFSFCKNDHPPNLRGHNFLTFSSFLSVFSAIDAQRGGLHLLFGHHKQWGPLAKMAKNLTLSVL
jgi:hypothetical protein